MTKKEMYAILDDLPDNAEVKIVSINIRAVPKANTCYAVDRIEYCLGKKDEKYILIYPEH